MAKESLGLNTSKYHFHITSDLAGQRVDRFLASQLERYSRTKIQQAIRDGSVLINDDYCTPRTLVNDGDQITVYEIASTKNPELIPQSMSLDILYEDSELIVVNKPAGLVVHPGAGNTGPTLVEGLLAYANLSSGVSESFRPGIVHRLDKDTSGVLVCAKTDHAHEYLAKQFREKTNLREYEALLDGFSLLQTVSVETYLGRDPQSRQRFHALSMKDYQRELARSASIAKRYRLARSHFSMVRTFNHRLTHAKIRLETGRTHQIRVHAKYLGLPIVGDLVYHHAVQLPKTFDEEVIGLVFKQSSQLLHARLLGFYHPKTHKMMQFEAPLRQDFKQILDKLEKYQDTANRG